MWRTPVITSILLFLLIIVVGLPILLTNYKRNCAKCSSDVCEQSCEKAKRNALIALIVPAAVGSMFVGILIAYITQAQKLTVVEAAFKDE